MARGKFSPSSIRTTKLTNQADDMPGILVLRPAHQAEDLGLQLQQSGFVVRSFPTIEIQPYSDSNTTELLQHINDFDLLIFISRNAVDYFIQCCPEGHESLPTALPIGFATAQALKKYNFNRFDINSSQYDSESLLNHFTLRQVTNQKILIVRGHGGRELLKDTLSQRGADVQYLEIYERCLARHPAGIFEQLWQQGISATIATSNQIIDNLFKLTDSPLLSELKKRPLVVISERMKQFAADCGFEHIYLAASPSDKEIVKTLKELQKQAILV